MRSETQTTARRAAAEAQTDGRRDHGSACACGNGRTESKLLDAFLEKVQTRQARIGVMGLGYVGLPLVRVFAGRGFTLTGFEVDQAKVDRLNRGDSYIKSVPSALLARHAQEGRFSATVDVKQLRQMDAVIVCVPTPLTPEGKPDVSYIKETAKAIAANLRHGQLVVLESTSYPGTTREIVKAEIERQGYRCGEHFFLAFSPEREDPGNRHFTTEQIPKIVGGNDPLSHRAATALYGAAFHVVPVSSCEAAESAKLLENIYRCVNIALVNELKMCFDRMGIDVWEVIAAAATKPFGFQAFHPGPGLGGHCIPIDPFYLSWKAREFQFNTRFIDLAGEVNIQMPYYVMTKLEEALRRRGRELRGAQVLLLGLAYKRDIDDPRESPSFKLLELLQEKGAKVVYNDPNIPVFPKSRHAPGVDIRHVALTRKELASKDAVIIVTDHSDYDFQYIVDNAGLVIDTRNACARVEQGREKIIQA